MATSSYVGIDVSKDRLDVAVLGEKQEKQVSNTKDGITQLVKQMVDLQPELIVAEATGDTNVMSWMRCFMLGCVWLW
jgi:transposase